MDMKISEELQRCIDFHGHMCPGLAIGYRAAKLGMSELKANRAEDEEIIVIVENNSCAVDAIQVLTGCTFGKGNLYFQDYGKMVFYFACRGSGRFIRLYFQGVQLSNSETLPENERRSAMTKLILGGKDEEIFAINRSGEFSMPAPASIHENIICDVCREMAMSTRIIESDNRKICKSCLKNSNIR